MLSEMIDSEELLGGITLSEMVFVSEMLDSLLPTGIRSSFCDGIGVFWERLIVGKLAAAKPAEIDLIRAVEALMERTAIRCECRTRPASGPKM